MNDGAGSELPDHREEGCRGLLLLTAFCALAIAYGSLIPFHFDGGRLTRAWELGALRWRGAGPEDILTNLAIYVPLGALIAGSALSRRDRTHVGASRLLAAAIVGGTLSLLLEIVQAALPARVPSLTDVALNVCGAVIGAMLIGALAHRFRSLADFTRVAFSRRPWHVAATAVTVGLLLFELMPFDFITTQSAFEDAFRRAEWNPFQTSLHAKGPPWLGGTLRELHTAGAFALLGYLACLASLEHGRPRATAGAFGVAHVAVAAWLVEVLQLFAASHALEFGSGLLRCFAGALGVWTAMTLGARMFAVSTRCGVAMLLPAAGVASLVVIEAIVVGCGIWLSHSWQSVADVAYSLLPFESMWRGSMSHAFADVTAVVAGAAAVSASLLLLMKSVQSGLRMALVVGAAGSLSLLVEVAQALSRGGACDVTSVAVAMTTAMSTCILAPRLKGVSAAPDKA